MKNKREVIPLAKIIEDPWFKSRPPAIQQAIKTWPPGWYRLKSTGQEVRLYAYEEDDGKCSTCKVIVEKGRNLGCLIFGIPLNDLEILVGPTEK